MSARGQLSGNYAAIRGNPPQTASPISPSQPMPFGERGNRPHATASATPVDNAGTTTADASPGSQCSPSGRSASSPAARQRNPDFPPSQPHTPLSPSRSTAAYYITRTSLRSTAQTTTHQIIPRKIHRPTCIATEHYAIMCCFRGEKDSLTKGRKKNNTTPHGTTLHNTTRKERTQ